MVRLEKHGDSAVRFIFTDSDHYLYKDGVVDVPVNSLSLVIDESEMVTFKKASTGDPFISFRLDKSNFSSRDELLTFYKENMVGAGGLSEEEVQQMIDAATSGIPSSEVVEQLRRDVNAVSGEVDTKQDILTAGENITISGNVISADAGNNIIELTQAEYDALIDKDPDVLYIITDASEINMNDYATKTEVDASITTKADTSALTVVNNSLTAHTANTTVHVTQAEKNAWNGKVDTTTYESGQYATAQALNALQENKLDASAYTPTDLSEYWTSGQTQEAINAATSGIPSSQVIETLQSNVSGLQVDVNDIWETIDLKEEVIASALTQLNQDVADIDAKEEVIASALTEVNLTLDNKLDASAYTPTDLSEYWTSAQTQSAIDGVKAYYIDFATIMTQGIHDADWDGIVNAINAHRPICAGVGGRYYTAECLTQDGGNQIIMTASDELNHYFYTFTKNGSNDYAFTYDTRYYVTNSEKNTWNTKQDELVSGTNIKTINNESILGSGNISLQEKLVSGTNIKTVNNQSILGSGNIDIQSGSSVTVDSALNSGSTNPVQNKAIAANILDHYESAKDIFGKPRYLKAITKSGGLSRPLSLYFSTINNKDIFANNGNEIVPTVNTFSLVETSAITTSMTSSSTDEQVPSAKAVYDQFGGLKLVKLTQAEYDALSTKDNQTLYIVVD